MGLFRRKEKQEPVKAKSAPVQKKTVKSGKKRNKNYKIENRTNYGNILSAEQKREIVKQKKKEAARRDVSVQNTVPYQYMSKDGICQVNNHYFTRCISFEDIGYSTSDLDVKSDIFNAWCDFYNFFTDTMRLQIFCISQPADMVRMEESIIVPTRDDEYNEIRTDLNDILRHQLQKGNNGYSRMKYIVFGIEGKSVKDVRKQINLLADEIRDRLSNMDVNSHVLSGYEWLCVLRHVMMPKNFDELLYNFDLTLRTGLNSKDFIVPASMSFRGFKNSVKTFRCGDYFGSVSFLQFGATTMRDVLLKKILEVDENVMVSIHVQPFSMDGGLKRVRDALTTVESNKVQQQQKAVRDGYDMDTISSTVSQSIDNFERGLDLMSTEGDRLFNITVLVCAMAESPKKLANVLSQVEGICRNESFNVVPMEWRQEDGFASCLPLGYISNNVKVDRSVLTRDLAGFIPFTVVELFQTTGQQLYLGTNALSGNVIMADRKTLDNPNGLILGPPGSGKTFATKEEIAFVTVSTDDDIFVIDPEGEYKDLVLALGGENIVISASSKQYINPMEIDIATWTSGNAADDGDSPEDAAQVKTSYVTSLMNIIIGDAAGLDSFERSIVNIAATHVYEKFQLDPVPEKMPILEDLYDELVHMAEIYRSDNKRDNADRIDTVAAALLMFIHGSANLFNHRTNVNSQNRIICFDIKNLTDDLKKIAMMTIQEMVWHRVHQNRELGKSTRYYMDEFHLLLSDPMTAEYTVKMFKRFRKYGGIPTGITQNVVDIVRSSMFLQGTQVGTIFANCDYIKMLKQRGEDVGVLQQELHFSNEERKFIDGTFAGRGRGLLFFGNKIIPFKDDFPKNTKMFELLQRRSVLQKAH